MTTPATTVVPAKLRRGLQWARARARPLRHMIVAVRRAGFVARRGIVAVLRKNRAVAERLWLPSGVATVEEMAARAGGGVKLTKLADARVEPIRELPGCNVPANRAYYEARAERRWDSTLCVEIEHGSVHGHQAGQFFTKDRIFLQNLGVEDWAYFGHGFIETRLRLPKPRTIDGTVAVVAHRAGYANFAHWVFDVLPRFEILRRCGALERVDHFAVGYEGIGFQRESLAVLGIDEGHCGKFQPDDFLQARTLIVPTHQRYEHVAHDPWVIAWLRKTFIPVCRGPRNRRLFISRADASFRWLLQEDELFARLQPLGFERVTMMGLGVSASAALFNQAEVVVGPFGSGLMNVVFCEPGTKFVEIATPSFYNCHHWHLCVESGVHHHAYFGGSGVIYPDRPLLAGRDDITLDAADCARFIAEVL